jgi:hypothetical protein
MARYQKGNPEPHRSSPDAPKARALEDLNKT